MAEHRAPRIADRERRVPCQTTPNGHLTRKTRPLCSGYDNCTYILALLHTEKENKLGKCGSRPRALSAGQYFLGSNNPALGYFMWVSFQQTEKKLI